MVYKVGKENELQEENLVLKTTRVCSTISSPLCAILSFQSEGGEKPTMCPHGSATKDLPSGERT